MGVGNQPIGGLIIARPMRYSGDRAEILWRIVAERTATAGIPVLGNVDPGHTDPMLTLPLGALRRVDAGRHEFGLVEPATGPS